MEHEISTSTHAKEVPTAAKWSVRRVRGGVAGDIFWVFGIMDMSSNILKEFKLTEELGNALSSLQPDAIVKKVFGCGTEKKLKKD